MSAAAPGVLSVVIVTFNSRAHIGACLTSLRGGPCDMAVEVVVVDNASSDGTADFVAREFADVALVRRDTNGGFSAGLNAGLRATRGRYAMWLNPDAHLAAGSLHGVIAWMDEHPDAGIVGGRILDPSGAVQLSARTFPSYGAALGHRYSLLTRILPGNPFSRDYLRTTSTFERIEPVDWVSGAFLIHRREVSDRLAGLDERFFMYCEDVDFCYRAHALGWQTYFHPGVTAAHEIGGSSRPVARRMIVTRHRSIWRYYAKHFRRNPVKDAVTWSAIWIRCAWLLIRGGRA